MKPLARLFPFVIALLVAVAVTSKAQAQADRYPVKPIRMIVPAAAAGPTDFLARIATDHLARVFGQPLVVENITGATGNREFLLHLRQLRG